MSATADLAYWIQIGTWVASTIIVFLLWTTGCIIALRRRPAPGATFLAVGCGLLAFVGLMTESFNAGQLLILAGVLEEIPINTSLVQFGYSILLLLLRVFGVALVVVGASQLLMNRERIT